MEHQYSLKWNNHPHNVATVFSRLRTEELFVDVTLATADRQIIRAHRMVLSAGSGYLERILALCPSDHPTIVLSNLRYKELKLLVDFMYSGEISVDQPLLGGLLEAANWLQIKGLYENQGDAESETSEPETEPAEPTKSVSRDASEEQVRSRKRNRSEESEVRCETPESTPEPSSPPTKVSKPVFGLSNTGWIMDNLEEKQRDESSKLDKDSIQDIPNLLNLASRQNFLQQFKTEPSSKPLVDPSLNDQMLQAMQLCGSSYLSQLAALQSCSPPLSSFTGSFTSFAAATSPGNGFKSGGGGGGGLLNSAPVRRYKQYSEDSLQAALKEIMEGQSINRSSMKHNIPARTLRDWMKRLNIKSVYTHHTSKDKDGGSVGSNSPEPDISLSLAEKFRNAAFGGHGGGNGGNTSGEIDDDESESLRIDESCHSLGSVAEMAA